MKNAYRIISLLLVFLFSAFSFASAETIDLSGLSYDELVALRQRIDLAIMQSDEWREVTVPVGTYTVGTDIPAGDYTVSYKGSIGAILEVYSADEFPTAIHTLGQMFGTTLIGKLTLSDGQVISISQGELAFSPYKGIGF